MKLYKYLFPWNCDYVVIHDILVFPQNFRIDIPDISAMSAVQVATIVTEDGETNTAYVVEEGGEVFAEAGISDQVQYQVDTDMAHTQDLVSLAMETIKVLPESQVQQEQLEEVTPLEGVQ